MVNEWMSEWTINLNILNVNMQGEIKGKWEKTDHLYMFIKGNYSMPKRSLTVFLVSSHFKS